MLQFSNSKNPWKEIRITFKTANINFSLHFAFLNEIAGIWRCISMTLITASQVVRTRGRDLTRYSFDDVRHKIFVLWLSRRRLHAMTNFGVVSIVSEISSRSEDLWHGQRLWLDVCCNQGHGNTSNLTPSSKLVLASDNFFILLCRHFCSQFI